MQKIYLSIIVFFCLMLRTSIVYAAPIDESTTSTIIESSSDTSTEDTSISQETIDNKTTATIIINMYLEKNMDDVVTFVQFKQFTGDPIIVQFPFSNASTQSIELPEGTYLVSSGVLNDNISQYLSTQSYYSINVKAGDMVSIDAFVGDAEYTKINETNDNNNFTEDAYGTVFLPNLDSASDYTTRIENAKEKRNGTLEEASSYFEPIELESSSEMESSSKDESTTIKKTETFNPNGIDDNKEEKNITKNKNNFKLIAIIIIVIIIIIIITIIVLKFLKYKKEE